MKPFPIDKLRSWRILVCFGIMVCNGIRLVYGWHSETQYPCTRVQSPAWSMEQLGPLKPTFFIRHVLCRDHLPDMFRQTDFGQKALTDQNLTFFVRNLWDLGGQNLTFFIRRGNRSFPGSWFGPHKLTFNYNYTVICTTYRASYTGSRVWLRWVSDCTYLLIQKSEASWHLFPTISASQAVPGYPTSHHAKHRGRLYCKCKQVR